MDEQAAFLRAIRAEPEDDATRLVFADWLEENGQEHRAAWVRASVRLGRATYTDGDFTEACRREYETFRLCRPEWWQDITGVTQSNRGGLFRFEVGSKTAAKRLGKVPWLGDALAGGWLESISVRWCDGSLAEAAGKWAGAAREVPLFVRPAPQITEEGLAFWLGVPTLWGLELASHAAEHPAIGRLGERVDLRELRLDGVPDGRHAATLLEQVARLSGLRRLTVEGHARPTDAHLRPLAGLAGLRELTLSWCVSLTDGGLAALHTLKGLRRLTISYCDGITAAGVAALREALPAAEVDVQRA